MKTDIKTNCLQRLNRIAGQVQGLHRMVETDRYCIDVITQLAAVRAALKRVEDAVLKDHVEHCVSDAMVSGSATDKREKIAELMDVFERAGR